MKRTISVTPSCFHPTFEMIISIPDGKDPCDYIDTFLDSILNEDLKYNAEWDFTDGIS